MSDITNIHSDKVNSSVVETLEELLESARNGDLQGLMYVDTYVNGVINHGWCGDVHRGVIAGVEDMKFNFYLYEYGLEDN